MQVVNSSKKMDDYNGPREKAIHEIKRSLKIEDWKRNERFIESLREKIKHHPVSRHQAIKLLSEGKFSFEKMQKIHLEYRHAIVQIFTDALLMAQHLSHRLEPRLAPGSKIPPRFLLTLNDLDEFGFTPGLDSAGYFRGNPAYAHYILFEDVCESLSLSASIRQSYNPSEASKRVRNFLEHAYANYDSVVALLGVAEEEVILFSPPLRKATRAVGIDVDSGYYHVHGVSTDESASAADDDHEDDLWVILTQAIEPDRFDEIEKICMEYCDLWSDFWTYQIES
ncbi:hypothetical protein EII20_00225 [Comamonadaceae bacterium OH2545_COT-014]|nr:hypothetical protein EII20_00225 [Comamonadaceae bacterium OH2545_COT-014]